MKKTENSFENLRLNDEIKFHTKKVRLVGDNVEVGIYDTYKALQIADELELDLVEISPNGDPPVCKIMDYNKFKYENKKKVKQRIIAGIAIVIFVLLLAFVFWTLFPYL